MKTHARPLALALALLATAAPAAGATTPGREGRLAYTDPYPQPLGSRIVTTAPDGSDPQPLLENAGRPQWSRDGNTLAYLSTSTNDVQVASADGSGSRAVAPWTGSFALSPDARSLVVPILHGSEDHERWYLYRISVATGARVLIAKDAERPAFSPDGRWVAFADRRHQGISRVRLDGHGKRVRVMRGHFVASLDWSPGGRSIAFVKFFRTRALRYVDDLAVVGVHSGRQRRLARREAGSSGFSDPAWSPTGRRLVVSHWNSATDETDLVTVRARDGQTRRLLSGGGDAAWRPLPRP